MTPMASSILSSVIVSFMAASPMSEIGFATTAQASSEVAVPEQGPTDIGFFRERYRAIRGVRSDSLRTEKMRSLAEDLELWIRRDETRLRDSECLELLRDTWSFAGDAERARGAAVARLTILRTQSDDPTIARKLLDEAVLLTSDLRFELAEWCCSNSLRLSSDPSILFRAMLARGRIIEMRDGDACAVEYYRQTAEHALNSFPDLTQEVLIRISDVQFREGSLDQAMETLASIEERFSGEPVEERARHMRRGLLELSYAVPLIDAKNQSASGNEHSASPRRPGYRAGTNSRKSQ